VRVDGAARPFRKSLVLPPGSTRLTFVGDGRKVTPDGDPRSLVFRVEGFTVSEPAVGGLAGSRGGVRR
jgi:hypothetical protein